MYTKEQPIHFIECSAAGMSSMMLLLHARGYTVTGSTIDIESQAARLLHARGCTIVHGYNKKHIPEQSIVVTPPNLPSNNEELRAAHTMHCNVLTRGHMLSELVRHYYTIAVAGAYGKTTTTALIGHILKESNSTPTVLTNEVMRNYKSTLLNGQGKWAVVEADEGDRSLLYLQPTIALISGIEHRHLNTYTDLSATVEAFSHFLEPIPFYGTAVLNYDDTQTRNLRRTWHGNVVTYGLSAHSQIRGHIVDLACDHSIINVSDKDEGLLGTITLPLVGSHNVSNAIGALAVCYKVLGIPFNTLQKACKRFTGVARRFANIGTWHGIKVIDDHAEHPSNLARILLAAQKCTSKKLHVIFQPHGYEQTRQLWNSFVRLFAKHQKEIETLHILPIYDPGQANPHDIDSSVLAGAMSDAVTKMSLFCYQEADDVIESIVSIAQRGDTVLTIGKGPIACIGEKLCTEK